MPFSNDNFLNQQPMLHSVQTFTQSKNQPNTIPLILSSASTYSTRYGHEEAETMVASEILGSSSPPYSSTGCAENNKV